jgi:alcohol dehydrogenase
MCECGLVVLAELHWNDAEYCSGAPQQVSAFPGSSLLHQCAAYILLSSRQILPFLLSYIRRFMSASVEPHLQSGQHQQQPGLSAIDYQQRTRLVFGRRTFEQLGTLARELGACSVLVVTDSGLRKVGHCDRAESILRHAGLEVTVFDQVSENPSTVDVDRCVEFARTAKIDLIVGLGGGSCLDCAKGTNFLLTNGGRMQDYKGIGKATKPMLPMIAVPTTSGTGSESQSFAVIADPDTHLKMACGDVKAACRVAVLDPELTVTMPRSVAAATGIDAMSHAIESFVTTKRNTISQMFSRQAWKLLSNAFPTVLREPGNLDARGRMQLGAFLSGAAIENSMLGAAHAAANPLTAQYGTTHGLAVGIMLPHVIRWNSSTVGALYKDLAVTAGWCSSGTPIDLAADQLADGFTDILRLADLPVCLTQAIDSAADDVAIEQLAQEAAEQWTGTFNPRRMDVASYAELYRNAL